MAMALNNSAIRDAIVKSGVSPFDYLLWCCKWLKVQHPDVVAERLERKYREFGDICDDLPQVWNLSWNVSRGNVTAMNLGDS
jgi:hypothetical protein